MQWVHLRFLDGWRDVGLLIARVGLGGMMVAHGVPKLMDPSKWAAIGGAVEALGITFYPVIWGGAAAITEVVAGALVALGLLTRPAAALVCITMAVAWWMHFSGGDPFRTWSHAAETFMGFLLIAFLGAGRYGLDRALRKG